jgi:hypothetical protein
MEKITTITELRTYIYFLEIKQANEKQLLKDEFKTTFENLKPVNLIKNALNDLTSAPDFKGNLWNAVLSLGAGFISRKVIVGATHNPLKQLLGAVLQMGVTSAVSKNGNGIKATITNLLSKFLHKKDTIV